MAVNILINPEAVVHGYSVKKVSSTFCKLWKRRSLCFNKIAGLRPPVFNFVKKETPALVFSSEFCKIFENTCFVEHQRTTAPTYLPKFS